MDKRDVVEALILNKDGEVLLQKKTFDYPHLPGGYWCFFGGEICNGESPEEAIKRELMEEIGIYISNLSLIHEDEYSLETGFSGKRFLFKGFFDKSLENIRLNEGGGFGFFDRREICNLKIGKMDLLMLEKYFKE